MKRESRIVKMQQLIEAWQQSGKKQQVFAFENNINYHTFRYWVDKLKKQKHTSEFIQIHHTDITETNICLRYPNGIELLLPAQTSLNLLKGLLRLT